MNGLLLGEDLLVAQWANQKFNLFPIPFFRAVGVFDSDKKELVGAAIFQNYTGMNIDLSYYGESTLTLGIVKSLARIALSFGVGRGTLITPKKNRRLIKSLLKLGFRLEGTQRRFYGHVDNARNTGVRLVIFKEGLEQLAGLKIPAPEPENKEA